MTTLLNNRWLATDHEFATRIEIPDVKGFFSKSVIVEPGFRALFLEHGESLGELPPGQHTLSNIVDKLNFWTQKSATVIIARAQDVRLEMVCPNLLTSEFLEVDVALSVTVRLEDVAMFFSNLMGAKSAISIEDIREIVTPFLKQSLWEAVGRLSIKDLAGDQKRFDVESLAPQSLQTALTRYGLRLGTVETLSISHPEYDDQLRRTGQLWLQRQQLDFDKEAARLAADKLFAQIEQQDKSHDLEILEKQVAADHMEANQVVRLRRIGIRKEVRAAILAGQFDRINGEEELARFLEQRDKERLIRQDEIDALKLAFLDKADDRVNLRGHLLRKLDMEQSAELDALRIDLNFAQKMKARRHEIALAELNQSDGSRTWKDSLQREATDAEYRRVEAHKQLEGSLVLARSASSGRRAEEAEESLHKLRISRIDAERTYESASLTQRISLLELETVKARDLASHEFARRQKELEAEFNRREDQSQNEWFRETHERNLAAANASHERKLRDERHQAELETMKLEVLSKTETTRIEAEAAAMTAKIQALRGASGFEVMAIAPEVALHAAEALKTQANATATIATANAQAAGAAASSEREQELLAQLSAAQRETLDRTTAAFREAMQLQQSSFQQFGSTMEGVAKHLAPVAPQIVMPGAPFGGPSQPTSAAAINGVRIVLCPGCRSENSETDGHCHRCGKAL